MERITWYGLARGWSVEWRTIKKISNDLSVDEPCVVITDAMPAEDASQLEMDAYYASISEQQESVRCAYIEPNGVYMMPQMAPYQTIEMIAVVKISTTAKNLIRAMLD